MTTRNRRPPRSIRIPPWASCQLYTLRRVMSRWIALRYVTSHHVTLHPIAFYSIHDSRSHLARVSVRVRATGPMGVIETKRDLKKGGHAKPPRHRSILILIPTPTPAPILIPTPTPTPTPIPMTLGVSVRTRASVRQSQIETTPSSPREDASRRDRPP